MALKLKAYACSECDYEFVIVALNKKQMDSTNPYCPECGSDEYTRSIDCVDLSISEHTQQYEIEKWLKPIPGVPPSQKLEYSMPPVYYEALKLVDPKWKETFLNFCETGEATPDFLSYLARDEKAQKATEMIFHHQSDAMQKFSRALSKK